LATGGTAEETAEKIIPERSLRPQRLKPHSKQCSYRSAEALRHPKSSATPTFSAASEAVSYPNPLMENSFDHCCGRLIVANDNFAS
jgi:hypothetical protein